MNCKNCNAVMKIDAERKLFICPYCNNVELMDSSSKEEIQELLKGALKDANKENELMMKKMIASHQREMDLARTDNVGKDVAIYVGLTVAACFTAIMAMFGLSTEYKPSGVVALIQFILFMAAIIAKACAKHGGNRKASVAANVCMSAGALLVIVWIAALTVTADTPEKTEIDKMREQVNSHVYDWPDEGYAKVVPRWGEHPDYSYAGDREFSASLREVTEDDFFGYVGQCKKDGFTIDVTEDNTHYNAYNDLGNELDVSYLSNSETIYVKLYPVREFGAMAWPTQGVMKDVPKPDSEELLIESMSMDFFRAFVNNITLDKYQLYVQECMAAGFDGRYEGGSSKFYGDKDGISISLELKRGKVMVIQVYE